MATKRLCSYYTSGILDMTSTFESIIIPYNAGNNYIPIHLYFKLFSVNGVGTYPSISVGNNEDRNNIVTLALLNSLNELNATQKVDINSETKCIIPASGDTYIKIVNSTVGFSNFAVIAYLLGIDA